MHPWRWLLLLGMLMAGAAATAQQQTLVVNGVPVAGVNSSLVTDQAYAPAETLAAALGADYDFDAGRQVAIFEMASRLLTLDIYADPKEAAVATQALKKNGKPRTSTGGILIQSQVMVPVKTLAMAFGGRVAYLAASNRVLVVTPRARLRLVRPPSQRDEVERFVLSFNAPAGMSRQDDIAQNQVIFRFPRTDYDQTRTFHGSNFREARLTGADGQVVFTLDLRPGSRYQSYTTPDPGGGFSLVVDVFAATSPQATGRETLTPRRIVLDPGHGGRDQGLAFPGVGSESTLTLAFAQRLASLLRKQGFEVELTRSGDTAVPMARRSSLGTGSDLYLSLHAAPLPIDELELYSLGDAADIDSLQMAMRENAETAVNSTATDAVRRRVLLDMVSNLELGASYAASLAGGLQGLAGYQVRTAQAPIYVLGGAAGRGLLLELGPDSLTSQALPETLAQLIGDLLPAASR